MSYIEQMSFSSISPEGFGGKSKYQEQITLTVESKDDIDEAIERAKTDFALKYRVDRRLVQVYRNINKSF